MPIIRTEKAIDPYARIHRDLLQDATLTYEARGLAAYLLSKPEDWEISVENLINSSPDGKRIVYRILKELRRAGYLNRTQARQGNRQANVIYTLYEDRKLFQPSLFELSRFEEAQSEQAQSELPQNAPLQIKKETNKREEQTKEHTQTRERGVYSKYDLETCRRYAQWLHDTGQGIDNPEGFAKSCWMTGHDDRQIGEFLRDEVALERDERKPVMFPNCPECGRAEPCSDDPIVCWLTAKAQEAA